MKSSSRILLVALVTCAVILLVYYFSPNTITSVKVEQQEIAGLPEKLQLMFKQKNLPRHWLLLKIMDKNISYASDAVRPEHFEREEKVINKIRNILAHDLHSIPNGVYLLSYEDGIHEAFPWPVLAFASNEALVANHAVILIPDFEAIHGYEKLFKIVDKAIQKYPWPKKANTIFWRGSATSGSYEIDPNTSFPRKRFMESINNLDFIDAGFTLYPGEIGQEMCETLKATYGLKERTPIPNSLAYKYLIDIDGNSCSYSRMAWIMYSNSVLFKHQTDKVQWYYDQIQPYQHYVPIDFEFSNLGSQFEWATNNQAIVQQISANAKLKAKEIFSAKAINQAIISAFKQYYELTKSV